MKKVISQLKKNINNKKYITKRLTSNPKLVIIEIDKRTANEHPGERFGRNAWSAVITSKKRFGSAILKNARYTPIEWGIDRKTRYLPLMMIKSKKLEIRHGFLAQKGN